MKYYLIDIQNGRWNEAFADDDQTLQELKKFADLKGLEIQTEQDFERNKQQKIELLRSSGASLGQKAQRLSISPEMQPEQIGGGVDQFLTGLADLAYPIASDVARRGGSQGEILGSAAIETPLNLIGMNPASMGARQALKYGAISGAGTTAARIAGGDRPSFIESGLSAASPMAIYGAGRAIKKAGETAQAIAPSVLQSVVVPKSGVMKGANPPDFDWALSQGDIVPRRGTIPEQISGMESNIEKKLGTISKERSNIPEWKNRKVNVIDGVFNNALDAISALDVSEARAVKKAIIDLRAEYRDEWGRSWKSVEDAMKERSRLSASSRVFSTDPETMSAKKKAKAIIAQQIGKYVENIAPEVIQKTKDMAPLMALLHPVENASDLTRGKVVIPLGSTQAMIAGGTIGGIPGAAAGYGMSKLLKTPAGAQALYDVGRRAQIDRPVIGATGRVAGQKASTSFTDGKRKTSDYRP